MLKNQPKLLIFVKNAKFRLAMLKMLQITSKIWKFENFLAQPKLEFKLIKITVLKTIKINLNESHKI